MVQRDGPVPATLSTYYVPHPPLIIIRPWGGVPVCYRLPVHTGTKGQVEKMTFRQTQRIQVQCAAHREDIFWRRQRVLIDCRLQHGARLQKSKPFNASVVYSCTMRLLSILFFLPLIHGRREAPDLPDGVSIL
jgi:hypothetical protein